MEKEDKSKKNIFSKLFGKKKKKEEKPNVDIEVHKEPKVYYAALTGMPSSYLSYFSAQFYTDIFKYEREGFSQATQDKIMHFQDEQIRNYFNVERSEGTGIDFMEILPLEISMKIFDKLDAVEWLKLIRVNKRFYQVLSSPDTWPMLARTHELSGCQNLSDCLRALSKPLSFEFKFDSTSIDIPIIYHLRNPSYWRNRTDSIDYTFFIITVDLSQFDTNLIQNDPSSNYLRQSIELLGQIAKLRHGQASKRLKRTFVVVFTAPGSLRSKLETVKFITHFPEAVNVIDKSVLDIIDFMRKKYEEKLSDVEQYGTVDLHVMEQDSAKYGYTPVTDKVQYKINKLFMQHIIRNEI